MHPSPHLRAGFGVCLALLVLTACGDRSGRTLDEPIFPLPATTLAVTTLPPEPVAPQPLTLIAPWVDGSTVPERHTCAGDGVSPALTWSNVPAGTIELAVTVIDRDAADFAHWIVYGIPVDQTGLVEAQPPVNGFEWPNSSGSGSWAPLCPPAGETHRYEFAVHALNQQLEVADDASTTEVISTLNLTTIAQSSVSGLVSAAP